MNRFIVSCTSDKIWNTPDLVGFLAANQHSSILLNIEPEAICLHNLGLYDLLDKFSFASVKIQTWNPLEKHERYTIEYLGENLWFNQTPALDPDLHNWDTNRVFLCFYHRPTAARLGLASYVYSHYQSDSLIHFSASDTVDFELDKLLQWDMASAANTATLLPQLPLLLGSAQGYTRFAGYHYTDPLTKLYRSILVDIVVESHVSGNTFFPTEKTLRPMLLKKPFIVFGSRDYLAYLRQMGFRTFSDFWNEDYDGYEHKDRLIKMQQLVDSIAAKSRSELEQMYWDMTYTLEHNYNLLQTKQFNRNIIPL